MGSGGLKKPDRLATLRHMLEVKNDANLQAVLQLAESDGWAEVASTTPGVAVGRKFMPPPRSPRVFSTAPGGGAGEAGVMVNEGM